MPNRVEFVEALFSQVESIIAGHDWVTKRYTKTMRDTDRTMYEVPFLTLQKGPSRLSLDPTAYDIPGAEAAVDLDLMPTYDPLATFYCEQGDWWVHSGFLRKPADERDVAEGRRAPLTPETIHQVLDAIAADAVPSV